MVIPFTYAPRSHPSRPIIASTNILNDIKTLPEEWHQSVGTLEVKPSSQDFAPLNISVCSNSFFSHLCIDNLSQLFVTIVRVFGLSDRIPFHFQISGVSSSLRRLLLGTKKDTHISAHCPDVAKCIISVTILRQVVVAHGALRTFRDVTLGEGKICSIPPEACHHDAGEVSHGLLSWDGQVQCQVEGVTGGFSIPGVTVKARFYCSNPLHWSDFTEPGFYTCYCYSSGTVELAFCSLPTCHSNYPHDCELVREWTTRGVAKLL